MWLVGIAWHFISMCRFFFFILLFRTLACRIEWFGVLSSIFFLVQLLNTTFVFNEIVFRLFGCSQILFVVVVSSSFVTFDCVHAEWVDKWIDFHVMCVWLIFVLLFLIIWAGEKCMRTGCARSHQFHWAILRVGLLLLISAVVQLKRYEQTRTHECSSFYGGLILSMSMHIATACTLVMCGTYRIAIRISQSNLSIAAI